MTKTISMHVCLLFRSLAFVCPGLRGGQLLVKQWKLDITSHSVQKWVFIREEKTIESAIPFSAPEKKNKQGLSPFHPQKIFVIGECLLLSPETVESFFHPLPIFPMTTWWLPDNYLATNLKHNLDSFLNTVEALLAYCWFLYGFLNCALPHLFSN